MLLSQIHHLSCVCFHCIYCYNYNLTRVCYPQQFIININNDDTSSINIFVTMTSFPPSATITHQQQPKRDPTMAIAKYRPTDMIQTIARREPASYTMSDAIIISNNNNTSMVDDRISNRRNDQQVQYIYIYLVFASIASVTITV